MDPECTAVQSKQITVRGDGLFGYRMRLMPWEMLTIHYIWTASGLSLMREDFRVCYELWTGGTTGPMVWVCQVGREPLKSPLPETPCVNTLACGGEGRSSVVVIGEGGYPLTPTHPSANKLIPPPCHKYKCVYSSVHSDTQKPGYGCISVEPGRRLFQHSRIICYNNVDRLRQTQKDI